MTDDSLAVVEVDTNCSPQERALVDGMLADEEMRVSAGERAAGLEQGQGYRWLRKGHVRAYMAAALADRRERHKDIRDNVIQALWQLATYDIADAIEETDPSQQPATFDQAMAIMSGGRLKPPHKLPPALRCAVKSVKWTAEGGWQYTFVDRAQILLALAKHFGDLDRNAGPADTETGGVIIERRKVVYYESEISTPTPPDKTTRER